MVTPNVCALDLNLLRVFDEVMAERHLSPAAHHWALTQPAVSNALRRLRESLGDDQVRRAGCGMQPTPVGLVTPLYCRRPTPPLRKSSRA